MPVVVTGANGLVGRTLIPLLVGQGAQVRAYVRRREAADPLRALGAKVAVGDPFDPDTLATVMSDAHTVCHLIGSLALDDAAAYERVNLGSTQAVLSAARSAKVARFLFLSYPGASPDAANAYLRAKGAAEQEVRGSGLQHAIVRSTHVYGPGSSWLELTTRSARSPVAAVVGAGSQRLAPVHVSDVAAVLAAADDRAVETSGTYGLQGPDVVTADELADLLAGKAKPKMHLSPQAARLGARIVGQRFSRTLFEVLAEDSLSDAPDAAEEFGVALTPLDVGLRALI